MTNAGLIYSKESLLAALAEVGMDVAAFFEARSPEDFFQPPGDGWSPAQNLEHLIRSVRPVARALRLPKVTLRLMFGMPKRDSRPYVEIQRAYVLEFSRGAQASGRFLPAQAAPPALDLGMARSKLLGQWRQAAVDSAAEKFGKFLGLAVKLTRTAQGNTPSTPSRRSRIERGMRQRE